MWATLPQHKCVDGGLRILLLADGETVDDDREVCYAEATVEDEENQGECLSLEPSLPSQLDMPKLSTIKLACEINVVPVLILVDSGANQNFLSKQLATTLGLAITPSRRVCMKMGDDRKVWMSEQCIEIPIKLGSFSFVTSAVVYDLGSLDMILGIAWLGTLGDVLCNWSQRRI